MDEIYNFRDKYLKEYRVKNTNISILKKAKYHRIIIQIQNIFTKPPKANLTKEKQPRAQHEYFT